MTISLTSIVSQAIGVPAGFEVSIYSSDPNLILSSSPIISGHRVGTSVSVPNNYDSLISIQIVKTDPTLVLPDYASVSIVASVLQKLGNVEASTIVGTEHILFNAAIRLSRKLLATQLLGGVANGFYFRDARGYFQIVSLCFPCAHFLSFDQTLVGDTDQLPRTGSMAFSPGKLVAWQLWAPIDVHRWKDIQPYGTIPDATFAQDFAPSNYGVDISTNRGSGSDIVAMSANYVYLRGNTNAVSFSLERILTSRILILIT